MQLPECQVLESAPERVVLSMDLQPDMPYFAGHFEGLPVLAGVMQVGWALALGRRHFGENRLGAFRGLRSTKFQQLVRPPLQLTLTLELKPQTELLKFNYRNHRGVCSSGGIQLAGAN